MCIYWTSRCTLHWISQQSMMIDLCFNFTNTLPMFNGSCSFQKRPTLKKVDIQVGVLAAFSWRWNLNGGESLQGIHMCMSEMNRLIRTWTRHAHIQLCTALCEMLAWWKEKLHTVPRPLSDIISKLLVFQGILWWRKSDCFILSVSQIL